MTATALKPDRAPNISSSMKSRIEEYTPSRVVSEYGTSHTDSWCCSKFSGRYRYGACANSEIFMMSS